MSTNENLIINNITKLYDGNRGIKSVSAVIKPGEITAVIGPNGSGKTTLVKSVAGLIKVSEGEILLFGINTSSRTCRSQIGYMQNDLSFYDKMTVYEVLDFICRVKYAGKYQEEINSYLQKYHLYEQRNFMIRELSLGMKGKLSIIMALIGTPKMILLDEPNNGIDTYGIIQLKEDLIRCSHKGSIIIITSHILDLLEKICTRSIFLKEGVIARDIFMEESDFSLEKVYEQIYISELQYH